ncbi:MAG: DUF6485 family protein [Bacillota bacterium]
MDCALEKNKAKCTCTCMSCSRRGACCACVEYHRSMGEIPGCFFPAEAEKTYDRSIENFIRSVKK